MRPTGGLDDALIWSGFIATTYGKFLRRDMPAELHINHR